MSGDRPAEAKLGGIAAAVDDVALYATFTARLKDGLNELRIPSPAGREAVIRLLEFLTDRIGELMDEHRGFVGEDELVVMHPATQALREVAEGLRDLKHGVVDQVLRPDLSGGSLAPAREIESARSAVALAQAIRATHGVSREEAERQAARAITKVLLRSGGRPVTPKQIRSWSKYLPRSPRGSGR